MIVCVLQTQLERADSVRMQGCEMFQWTLTYRSWPLPNIMSEGTGDDGQLELQYDYYIIYNLRSLSEHFHT